MHTHTHTLQVELSWIRIHAHTHTLGYTTKHPRPTVGLKNILLCQTATFIIFDHTMVRAWFEHFLFAQSFVVWHRKKWIEWTKYIIFFVKHSPALVYSYAICSFILYHQLDNIHTRTHTGAFVVTLNRDNTHGANPKFAAVLTYFTGTWNSTCDNAKSHSEIE